MSNWIKRKKTSVVNVGGVPVGGGNPISVQSMTNTNTSDVHNPLLVTKLYIPPLPFSSPGYQF